MTILNFASFWSIFLLITTLIMLEFFNYERQLATQDLKLCFPFRAVRFS
jgi:hypothetical protein